MEYIVEMERISKSFPGVKALDNVSLQLRAGEVLALVGENGAGKSTLMKILSGVYSQDEGTIRIFDKEIDEITPTSARELGIAIIHQELNMCADLTVAQNIYLGWEVTKSGLLSNGAMRIQAKKSLDRLGVDISPDAIVGDLSLAKQQMVEICKALSTDARILIMDEPTSALSSREISELFGVIRTLRDEGRGIVYISHRLEELHHIVDRVQVMRDGKVVAVENFADTSVEGIISAMVGRQITEQFPHVDCERGDKIFEVRGLNAGRSVRGINLDLYEGEIVGIAGLMGAGRTELTRAIFGIDAKDGGQIFLDGKEIRIDRPIDAINAGIVLTPEDRKRDGLCARMSVKDNLCLPNLDRLSDRLSVVRSNRENDLTNNAITNLGIKVSNSNSDADTLSGGNQQKVVIGKWLARESRVMIFDEPTRGIDVAAKVEIYHLMNRLKQRGIGVLFVSSEMTEIMGMSDRIIVMCDGRITGTFSRGQVSQDTILAHAMKFEINASA